MDVKDPEVESLIRELDLAQQAWIHGKTEKGGTTAMLQDEDMTIFGPFGGGLVTNGPDLEARQAAISAKFRGGKSSHEVLNVIRSGAVVVLMLVERNEVQFEGQSAPQRFDLRTTQVFRRDGDRWLRLHRHADPLLDRRSFEATIALAAGWKPEPA
jgi:ketosteroid isomerase-like protein